MFDLLPDFNNLFPYLWSSHTVFNFLQYLFHMYSTQIEFVETLPPYLCKYSSVNILNSLETNSAFILWETQILPSHRMFTFCSPYLSPKEFRKNLMNFLQWLSWLGSLPVIRKLALTEVHDYLKPACLQNKGIYYAMKKYSSQLCWSKSSK